MCRVGKSDLFGEGTGIEPVEQLRAPGRDHLHLREMDMRVDEPGHHQVRAVVGHRQAGGLGGDLRIRPRRADHATR
jgi:hypothetical protein